MLDHKHYWGKNFLHRWQVFSILNSKPLAFRMQSLWYFCFQHFAILANTHWGDNFLIPKQVFSILDNKSLVFLDGTFLTLRLSVFRKFGYQISGQILLRGKIKFRCRVLILNKTVLALWQPVLHLILLLILHLILRLIRYHKTKSNLDFSAIQVWLANTKIASNAFWLKRFLMSSPSVWQRRNHNLRRSLYNIVS